jgi:hypothetical protein
MALALVGAGLATAAPAAADAPTVSFTEGIGGHDLYVNNGRNSWELNPADGSAWHTNLRSDSVNSISVSDFLKVWYGATGKSVGTANLSANEACAGGGSYRAYFTRGYVTRFVAWASYIAVSFEAPRSPVDDRQLQTGGAAYVLAGSWASYGALVNVHVNAFEGGAVTSDTDTTAPATYELTWSQAVGSAGFSVGADGRIMYMPADPANGDGLGRCGTTWGTYPAASPNALIWYTSGVTTRDDL